MENNENGHQRGLHIVVFNPFQGIVNVAKVFDTYKSSYQFGEFIAQQIPDEHIVIAACKDDCTQNLSNEGKLWFASMGSEEIWKLHYRQGFALIGVSGRKSVFEKRADTPTDSVTVT